MNDWKAPSRLPKHVAIIMDGNGRYAKRHGIPRVLGHRKGVNTLRDIVSESSKIGIEVLSVFGFSTENWKRSAEEVGALMGLLLEFFQKETNELHRNNVNIRILGDVAGLPAAQRASVERSMRITGSNTGLKLNIALNYGGRDEIRRAFMRLYQRMQEDALDASAIDEAMINSVLDTAGQPDVDLLIRPSGELRLSNFLLFQSAYAEFVFCDTLWPDFTVQVYHETLDIYAQRDRRHGGRKERGEEEQ